MAEKIIFTLTTSRNDFIRIKELNFFERLSAEGKFVIEKLTYGTFKLIHNPYFQTEEEAQNVINKIYNLDMLFIKRNKAVQKVKDSFLESIKGTREYEFYEAIVQIWINDYDIRDGEPCVATFSEVGIHDLYPFLRKYGYPTEFKSL